MTQAPVSGIPRKMDILLKLALLAELGFALWERSWLTAAATTGIFAVTLLPYLLRRRFRFHLPSELELFAVVFVFASLFLGEVRDYYTHYPWWDTLLHATSGVLLGIFGFLLVHVLNEAEEIDLHMKPGFVAFFAFLFALGMGVWWEIFEFAMDGFAGTNMQKPMFGDASGLTDTMWDLIMDSLGALVLAVLGYGWLKTKEADSFLERWMRDFVGKNPHLFRRAGNADAGTTGSMEEQEPK